MPKTSTPVAIDLVPRREGGGALTPRLGGGKENEERERERSALAPFVPRYNRAACQQAMKVGVALVLYSGLGTADDGGCGTRDQLYY